jgi:cardiolipin synthase
MYNKLNLPLTLTWFRIFLVPIFVGLYYVPDQIINYKDLYLALVFVIASFTDYLDGYLARLLNQESDFGAFLDPVADKAIIAASLIMLIDLHRTYMIAAIIIIIREIAISALREWMAIIGKNKHIAVAYIGKLKTVLQMVAITLLLSNYQGEIINAHIVGNYFMWLAVVITIFSMFYYLYRVNQILKTN